MSITSSQLAKMCNVSRATVDRALKGKPGIHPDTRKRILAAASANNYTVNTLASSLSTGRTHSVGVVILNLTGQYYSAMVNAMQRKLWEYGLMSYICLSEYDKERERVLIESLLARKVDGLILLPIHTEREFCNMLKSAGVPVVTVSNRLYDLPYVGGDDRTAVYQAMCHYAMHGFDTVHFVCPPLAYRATENIYAQAERAQGYQLYRQNNPGMTGELIIGEDYLDQVRNLLRSGTSKPGIFCSSDVYMLQILRMLSEEGWDMEEKCALMGFDGSEVLSYLPRRPASILYPAQAIGETSATLLHDLMSGSAVNRQQLLPCPLLPGNATFPEVDWQNS